MRFPDLSFNVSHHGDYVVIVSDPVSPMGVDIATHEKHFDLHPEEVFEVYATSFTAFEWKTIRSGGPDSGGMLDQFFRLVQGFSKAPLSSIDSLNINCKDVPKSFHDQAAFISFQCVILLN